MLARSLPLVSRLVSCLALLALIGLIACCGGGGGSSGAAPGGGGGGGGGGASMTAAELQLSQDALAAMNTHRAGLALPPLLAHAGADQVAYAHSLDMRTRNFFNHVNPDGLDGSQRIAAAGIANNPGPGIVPANFAGENIASGTNALLTGPDVVNAWLGSPGHHTQIDAPLPVAGAQTMPPWTHCGIGVHQGPGGTIWWTAVFLRNPVP